VDRLVTGPDGPDAALEQGTRNAERIAALDAAVASVAARLAELGTAVDVAQGTIAGQADVLRTVDGLKDTVDELICRFNGLFPDGGTGVAFYTPIPAPRFWQLHGQDREQAIGRLRSWVRDVYQPAFGHLAAKLPACWEQHTFCLTVLDVASELHTVLYLQATRNQGLLAGQAELLTRLMPALAALMAAEAGRCPHAQSHVRPGANGGRRPGDHGTALPAFTPGPDGRG
jgi:hypothetical protein